MEKICLQINALIQLAVTNRSKSYPLGFWSLHHLYGRLTGLPNVLLSQLPSTARTESLRSTLERVQQPKDNISPIKQLSFFI